MLSINPQRGRAEKLRLAYAFKGRGCSAGLPLVLPLLLALKAFMPCRVVATSGRSDRGIASLLIHSQPLHQVTASPDRWGHGIKSRGTGEGIKWGFPLFRGVSWPKYTTSEGQWGCSHVSSGCVQRVGGTCSVI